MSDKSPLIVPPVDKNDPYGLQPLVATLIAGGAKLPDEKDDLRWAWRLVLPDLRSTHGYRWPFPGEWAVTPDDGRSLERDKSGEDPCPSAFKGGLCLAKTIAGARSGGMELRTALVCGYLPADLLGESGDKLRVRRAWVLDVIDPSTWLVRAGANLTRANLTGANLTDAYLTGAYLTDAYLTRANLTRANLTGANLTGANLTGANLTGANLTDAYLTGAYLTDAYLTDANLTDANLTDANLTGAYLTDAYLTGANLTGANLTGANLTDAYLTGARYSQLTLWPTGFDSVAAGAVLL